MKIALVAVVAAAAGVAAGCGGSRGHLKHAAPPPPPPPNRTQTAAIRQLVLRAAARRGDPHPGDAILVPTNRRRAELVDLDTNEPPAPVYFVLVHGSFKGGTLLTLTIDPHTNRSLGTGLVAAMPRLRAIGRPQPLRLER